MLVLAVFSDAREITARDVAEATRNEQALEFLACPQLQTEVVEKAGSEDS